MGDVMTLTPTLSVIGLMIAVIIGLAWVERRPREFGKLRFPTTPFIFLAIFVIVIMASHLLGLAGVQHGR
ncbi:MAG: hypothetical protein WA138_14885 [Parvibaculum sp.]